MPNDKITQISVNNILYDIIDQTAQNSISILENKVLPSTSSSDDGKFLRVVDGAPAWDTVPQAENNTF